MVWVGVRSSILRPQNTSEGYLGRLCGSVVGRKKMDDPPLILYCPHESESTIRTYIEMQGQEDSEQAKLEF